MIEYYIKRTTPSGAAITELVVEGASPVLTAATRITQLAFRNRFTPAEKVALYTAAKTNVDIQIYLDDVAAATFIDLQRADTRAAVQGLEAAGLLAPGRALEILDAPIQQDERPLI